LSNFFIGADFNGDEQIGITHPACISTRTITTYSKNQTYHGYATNVAYQISQAAFSSLLKLLHQTHSKTSRIFSGRISLSVIFGFSQVSQPNRMSGLLESRRFHRASRLLLMLWMFKQTDLNLLSNFFY
jgi:hypothetical protein